MEASTVNQDLQRDIQALEEELKLTRQEVVAQTRANEALEKEIQRLKEGHFTDDEFQYLCHTFPPEKVNAFRRGCYQYQAQLFGEEMVQHHLAQELRWALHQAATIHGLDGLAETLSRLIIQKPTSCKEPCHGTHSSPVPRAPHSG